MKKISKISWIIYTVIIFLPAYAYFSLSVNKESCNTVYGSEKVTESIITNQNSGITETQLQPVTESTEIKSFVHEQTCSTQITATEVQAETVKSNDSLSKIIPNDYYVNGNIAVVCASYCTPYPEGFTYDNCIPISGYQDINGERLPCDKYHLSSNGVISEVKREADVYVILMKIK